MGLDQSGSLSPKASSALADFSPETARLLMIVCISIYCSDKYINVQYHDKYINVQYHPTRYDYLLQTKNQDVSVKKIG